MLVPQSSEAYTSKLIGQRPRGGQAMTAGPARASLPPDTVQWSQLKEAGPPYAHRIRPGAIRLSLKRPSQWDRDGVPLMSQVPQIKSRLAAILRATSGLLLRLRWHEARRDSAGRVDSMQKADRSV